MHKIGDIVALQIQRDRIKIKGVGYLPELIAPVEEASLYGGGMIGHYDGSWAMDVHHPLHPTGKGNAYRSVSFGFTSHYAAMRGRFGIVPDFVGGENIIVDTEAMIALEDLTGGVVVRTAAADIDFNEAIVLAPCREFTSHLLGLAEPADKEAIADDIAFLADGMRGFGAGVDGGPFTVSVGDEMWVKDD